MDITPAMNEITNLIKISVQQSLLKPRPATTYVGTYKPVSGKYPTPVSDNVASGALYKSINVYWENDLESPLPNIVVEMEDYGFWVDNGRRPSKTYSETRSAYTNERGEQKTKINYKGLVPFQAIKSWLADKPGVMVGLSEMSKVFLISRSIARDGYGAKNFIQEAITEVLPKLEDDNGPIAESVVEYINQLFDEGKIFPRTTFNTP